MPDQPPTHATLNVPNETPAASPPPPACVPGYEILSELGRGGMGVVYKAHHLHLNRVVALKMILAGSHAGPTDLVRFRQEAEMVARLQHPNIVAIHEVGAHAGHSYLALEFVEGGSLAHKTAGIPQPPRDAARLVELLARAVEFAHQAGIVHRDLSPGNVLLTLDGAPKLTDFGLARHLGDGQGMTATGAILGTPGYLAPEQARGDRNVGRATDVYGLGGILYTLLTGRPPFQASSVLTMLRLTESAEPTRPTQLCPQVPRDLETICLKCLSKEPGKRYPGAAELADDLQRFLADEPIRARRVGRLERLWLWCRRNPFVAAPTGLAIFLLLLIAVGGIAVSLRLSAALAQAEQDRDAARKAQRESREKLFESLVAEAKAARFSRRQGQRHDSLVAIGRAAELARELDLPPERIAELRNLAIAVLTCQDLRSTDQQIAGFPPWWPYPLHSDRSLERHVILGGDKTLEAIVLRTADGKRLASVPAWPADRPFSDVRTTPIGCRFSGDGRFLGVWNQHEATIWDLTLPKPRPVAKLAGDVVGVCFTPDDRRAAIGRADGTVSVRELPDGSEVRIVRAGTSIPRFEQGSRPSLLFGTSRHLAVWRGEAVRIVDVEDGSAFAEFRHPQEVDHFDWSREGQTLAVACGNDVYLWDVPTKRQLPTLKGHVGHPKLVAFSPSSELLISVAVWGDSVCLWQPQTGELVLRAYTDNLRWLHAANDDRLMMSGRVWELSPQREYRTLRDPLTDFRTLEFPLSRTLAIHRDGRLLAVGGDDGVRLWDLATGRKLAMLPLSHTKVAFDNGSLLTQGAEGTQRWPVQVLDGRRLRVGPPEHVADVVGKKNFASSRDGSVIAWANRDKGSLLRRSERPGKLIALEPQRDVRSVAVSPDGEYVASANWWWGDVKVWQSSTGKELRHWPNVGEDQFVAFSGDGRLLAAASCTGTTCRLWRVGTWDEAGTQQGRSPAFSPDGLMALETGKGIIRLVRLDTRAEVARLEDPGEERAAHLRFSPDGTRLVALSIDSPSAHVWDLRRIRAELAKLGLDWAAPAYPAEDGRPGALVVEVAGQN